MAVLLTTLVVGPGTQALNNQKVFLWSWPEPKAQPRLEGRKAKPVGKVECFSGGVVHRIEVSAWSNNIRVGWDMREKRFEINEGANCILWRWR